MRRLFFCLIMATLGCPNLAVTKNSSAKKTIDLIDAFVPMHRSIHLKRKDIDPEYVSRFVENRKARFITLLEENGLKELSSTHRNTLWEKIEVDVRDKVRRALSTRQFSMAMRALREVTTDRLLHNHMAKYMGLPPPRSGSKLGEITSTKAWGDKNQLYIVSASITAEEGGLNAGNGAAEFGEWVQLGLMIKNGSNTPWFSTSIYPKSDTPECLWVKSGEIEPGEFLEKDSSTIIRLWTYISPTCKGTPQLRLTFRDTHRSPGGIGSTVKFIGKKPPKVRIVDVMLDSDFPGESSGSKSQRIKPGERIELSHGVEFSISGVKSSQGTMTVAADQAGILGNSTVTGRFHRVSSKRFEAGDDLDLVTVNSNLYLRGQKRYGVSRKFFPVGEETGKLWVAVDIRSIIGGSTKSATHENDQTMGPDLSGLVRKNLRFEARSVRPKNPNAIATVGGHDVLFNSKGFAAELSKITGGTSERSGENFIAENSTVFENRQYFSVDMATLLKPEPPPVRPVIRTPRRRPPPKPVVKKAPLPDLRFDFGYADMDWTAKDDFKDASLGLFSTSIHSGKKLTGFVHLHAGSGSGQFFELGRDDFIDADWGVFTLAGGAGYVIGNPTVEFHPRIGLGISYRSIDNLSDSFSFDTSSDSEASSTEASLNLMLGATLRVFPSESIGAYVAWDNLIGGPNDEHVGQFYSEVYSFFGFGLCLRL